MQLEQRQRGYLISLSYRIVPESAGPSFPPIVSTRFHRGAHSPPMQRSMTHMTDTLAQRVMTGSIHCTHSHMQNRGKPCKATDGWRHARMERRPGPSLRHCVRDDAILCLICDGCRKTWLQTFASLVSFLSFGPVGKLVLRVCRVCDTCSIQ